MAMNQLLATQAQGLNIAPALAQGYGEARQNDLLKLQEKRLVAQDSRNQQELALKQAPVVARALGNVKDQASYDAARQFLASNKIDISKMDGTYRPELVDQYKSFAGELEKFGAATAGVDPVSQKPVFFQTGDRGTVRPVTGVSPAPKVADTPSSVQEWQYFNSLPQDQKDAYLRMKRATPVVNLGGEVVQPSPTQPGVASGVFTKTLPPEAQPEVRGAQTAATEAAKTAEERAKNLPKAQSALAGLEQQSKLVTGTIDKALGAVSSWSTGMGNMVLSGLPNTQARQLNNYLDTIKANIGFDKLQQMRDSSPTGGALGQVSDTENRLLQAVNGALDPLQRDQLVENLTAIKGLYPQVLAERRRAFAQDYGGQPAPAAGPAPNAAPTAPGEWQDVGNGVKIRRKQ